MFILYACDSTVARIWLTMRLSGGRGRAGGERQIDSRKQLRCMIPVQGELEMGEHGSCGLGGPPGGGERKGRLRGVMCQRLEAISWGACERDSMQPLIQGHGHIRQCFAVGSLSFGSTSKWKLRLGVSSHLWGPWHCRGLHLRCQKDRDMGCEGSDQHSWSPGELWGR